MKRVIMLLLLTVITTVGYAQKGKTSAGFTLGHAFDTENVIAGIDLQYNVTDEVRLAPSLSHFIKNNGLNAWAIDINAHYVFTLSDVFGFYPLGGVGLTFWDYKWRHSSMNRFGLNVGLGGEIYATKEITVGLEMKYNIMSDLDQAIAGIRIGYTF
ncbi:outer membrane beta-barrel protein [Massilibacteroides vaginae]|uniref:outer membrane beta-barrel protein n=1 Tax=Massilibacteroides vaginae TaxID=1673718 RepID=UPI000A1CBA48|nr:outer membrane beta-barrel protein [Massilibacteroides vaginae]